jgi:DNA-binding transcriptional regulator LsrR (DeoR family)
MALKDYMMKETERVEEKKIYEGMTGAEIGKELGITRQAVSNTLKRAMKKVFIEMKKETGGSDFEVAVSLMIGLGVEDSDAKNFFKLFPPDIRKKIEDSANETLHGKK